VQEVACIVEKLPAGQLKHEEDPSLGEYVPARQALQELEP
jgi:hypothetical protein